MPGIYFVNPKGFKNVDTLPIEYLDSVNYVAAMKDDRYESLSSVKSEEEVEEEFKVVYKNLMKDKDKPTLVFDTRIHSGETLFDVMNTLQKLGFSKIKVGSINHSQRGSLVPTDLYLTNKPPEMGCYPFDQDRLIEKTFEHVYSSPSSNYIKRAMSYALRKEIKKIMSEYI